MRITKVKLDNYVCFHDAPEFELGPGINFVVGKNNSGKTALLDALTLHGRGEAHRSIETLPERNSAVEGEATTAHEVGYEFEEGEVLRLAEAQGGDFFFTTGLWRQDQNWNTSHARQFLHSLDKVVNHSPRIRYRYKAAVATDVLAAGFVSWKPVRIDEEHIVLRLRFQNLPWSIFDDAPTLHHVEDREESSWVTLSERMPGQIYRFDAERRIPASGAADGERVLKSDCSNLPDVVNQLRSTETALFNDYVALAKQVLPSICEILTPTDHGNVELKVSYYEPSQRRPDLAVSLSKCGTGVGQILAMLYVVVTSEEPRVIIIDEPNSFLHPGAVRKLLEVFQEYDHHQYIIATHSPTAIMSVQKKRILHVTRKDMRSRVDHVEVVANSKLEAMLKSIGTRRSDIFGMDAVIWVEGKTDEKCFNLIMEHNEGLRDGIQILRLVNTGDIERDKDAALVVQIYERLSGGLGIMPSALGFVFDGDKAGAHGRLGKEYRELISYLPRQNYENYLLDYPDIIAEELKIGADSVTTWIRENSLKSRFYNNGVVPDDEGEWLSEINGAKFIEALFDTLSNGDFKFNKVKHGEALTRRILDEHPSHFKEIVDLLTEILQDDE